MDAVQKLKEIAARDLGGSPGDYDVGNETVFARANPSRRLTYAAAAQRAIQLGGRYSGEQVPDEINPLDEGGQPTMDLSDVHIPEQLLACIRRPGKGRFPDARSAARADVQLPSATRDTNPIPRL